MDQHLSSVIDKQLARTAKALEKHRFEAKVIRSREELFAALREYLPAGASCTVGGSMTLFEAGVIDFLKNGDYRYLDRYAEGADVKEVYRQAFGCDVYLTSSNAITETGELYNMDGRGNRVAAMIYGPEKVVVVAGYNKIVPDLEAARERNRGISAPANALRLGKEDIPCYHAGRCQDCLSPGRFCNAEVVLNRPTLPGRIAVLLVNERLGY